MGKSKKSKNVLIHQAMIDAYQQHEDIYRMNMPTAIYGCYGDCGADKCSTCCFSRKPTRKEIEQARQGHTICAPKPRAFPFYSPYDPLNPGYAQPVSAYPVLCPPFKAEYNGQYTVCTDRWCAGPRPTLIQGRDCAAPARIVYNCGNCNVGTSYVNQYGLPN